VAERNLDARLLEYGARVIRLVEALPKTLVCNRIGDQLLRSGMAVGANYEEAQGAESRPDFNHKLQIALKELRESNYWLRLLEIAGKVPRDRLADIIDEYATSCNPLKGSSDRKGESKMIPSKFHFCLLPFALCLLP
jgi:four helix bundle protein